MNSNHRWRFTPVLAGVIISMLAATVILEAQKRTIALSQNHVVLFGNNQSALQTALDSASYSRSSPEWRLRHWGGPDVSMSCSKSAHRHRCRPNGCDPTVAAVCHPATTGWPISQRTRTAHKLS